MFEMLMEEGGGGMKMPQLLSSHPATTERIDNVAAEIETYGNLPRLRSDDGGRLDIIKRRIRLITGTDEGSVSGHD